MKKYLNILKYKIFKNQNLLFLKGIIIDIIIFYQYKTKITVMANLVSFFQHLIYMVQCFYKLSN